jgi:hypothetical protein
MTTDHFLVLFSHVTSKVMVDKVGGFTMQWLLLGSLLRERSCTFLHGSL